MKTIVAIVLVLVAAAPAFAEWGLYANRDGKGFVMEKTFAFQKDCESAARAAWQAAQQKGAFGCVEYSATSFAHPYYRPSPQPSKEEPFGEKFRQSQQRQRQQEIAEQQRRENERRRQELLQIERDKVRAIERANEIEQQKIDALRGYR